MKKYISYQFAAQSGFFLFCLLMMYHFILMISSTEQDSYGHDIAMASGRDLTKFVLLQMVNAFLLLSFLIINMIQTNQIEWPSVRRKTSPILWAILSFMILNFFMHLLAPTIIEKSVSIFYLCLAIFSGRIILETREIQNDGKAN